MKHDPRRTAATAAAATFLAWHAAAIMLAPFPDSALRQTLGPVFEPYLRVAYLDHRWTFFGPRPDPGRLVRYEVIRQDGSAQEFLLSEAVSRTNPDWFRWLRLFDRVATGSRESTRSAALYLCRRHAALAPLAIRFVVLHQLTPSPELYRAGVRPTDREALWREPGDDIACATAPGAD